MKRRLTKLVVFLLLGAIVNVAVAWGCAICAPLSRSSELTDTLQSAVAGPWSGRYGAPDDFSELAKYRGFGRQVRWLRGVSQKYDDRGVLVYWIDQRWVSALNAPWFESREYELLWEEAGFPCASMQAGEWVIQAYPIKDLSPIHRMQMGVALGPFGKTSGVFSPEDRNTLLLQPMWPGFAINTFFYAAIVWVLWSSPFTARRMVRRKRGRCINCGYDLRGTSGVNSGGGGVCSECGAQSA